MMAILQTALRRVPVSTYTFLANLQHRNGPSRFVLRVLRRLVFPRSGVIPSGLDAGFQFDRGDSLLRYLLGTYEPRLQSILPYLVRPGDVVFDVGANVGFFTIGLARLVGPGGQVVAFEPLAENAITLQRNVDLNQLRNVRVMTFAVGDSVGRERLLLGGGSTVAKLAHTGTRSDVTTAVTVDVMSLDHVCESGIAPLPQFIKMDTEGAEVAILRGMRGLLNYARPLIVCELHDTHEPVADLLAAANYSCVGLEDSSLPLSAMHWNAQILAYPAERTGEIRDVASRWTNATGHEKANDR